MRPITSNLLVCSALTMVLSACAPMSATYYDPLEEQPVKQGADSVQKNQLWCFDGKTDFELRTAVTRFDMTSDTSAHAGFSGIPGIPFQAIGLNFRYASGQLDTSMSLYQPMKTTELTTQSGRGETHDISFGFDLLAGWGGGIQHQSKTPIYDLSADALMSNLSKVISVLPHLGLDAWSTNAIDVLPEENGIFVPIGLDAGVQVGDEFKIMNVNYDWAGTPCASELRMIRLKSSEPIAIAVAEEVRSDVSFLRLKGEPTAEIEKFAYVTISKLVPVNGKTRTNLGRSIRIGRVSSQPLRFKIDSTGREETIDLAPMVYEQLKVLLRQAPYSSSFYLRN